MICRLVMDKLERRFLLSDHWLHSNILRRRISDMECSVNELDFSRKRNRKTVINFTTTDIRRDLCELQLLECAFKHGHNKQLLAFLSVLRIVSIVHLFSNTSKEIHCNVHYIC